MVSCMMGLKASSDAFTRSSMDSTFMVVFSNFLVSGSLVSIILSRYSFFIVSMKGGDGVFCIRQTVKAKQPENRRIKA